MSVAPVAPPDSRLVDRILADDRRRTLDALVALLPRGEHGDVYELAADYPTRPSKGIRPAICLATCRAFGGRTEDALGTAVAIELLHNAFLVHDDICDDALRRRGGDALHVRHGVPLALIAGDALAWLAIRPLVESASELGPGMALELLSEFQQISQRTIEGQADELAWRDRDLSELGTDHYLALVRDKTCWYSSIGPCRTGALIGSRGTADLDAIARFGFFLGALLQIRDDVENVTDRDGVRGKDFGSDVIEGKPTILVIHLLSAAGREERERALQLIGPGPTTVLPGERIETVISMMERHGSVDYTCAFAEGVAGAALAELEAATAELPDSADLSFLRALVLHLRDPVVRGR